MFCTQCGNEVLADAKFCSECGRKVIMSTVAAPSPGSGDEQSMWDDPNTEATRHYVRKKKKRRIFIPFMLVLILLCGAACYFFINAVKPTFSDNMSAVSVEDYLSNANNYELSHNNEILLTLNDDFLNGLLYQKIADSRIQNNGGMVFHSLRCSDDFTQIRINASFHVIPMEISYDARIDFIPDGEDIVMVFHADSPAFGPNRWRLSPLLRIIPDAAYEVSVVLPGLGQIMQFKNAEPVNGSLTLVLNPNIDAVTELLAEMEPYLDESYTALIDTPHSDLRDSQLKSFSENGASELLCCYTSEGIDYIVNRMPILGVFITEEYINRLEQTKDNVYKNHENEIERYLTDMWSQRNSAVLAGAPLIKTNGKVYTGGINSGSPMDINSFILPGDIPRSFDPSQIEVMYDIDTKLIGISYLKDADTYKAVFEDGTTKEYERSAYEALYHRDALPKGEIEIPMPGDKQHLLIVEGIKTYLKWSGDTQVFVRYMRNDEKYAYAVVSPADDFQNLYAYVLMLGNNGEWNVLAQGFSEDEWLQVLEDNAFIDMNMRLFPSVAPSGCAVHIQEDLEIYTSLVMLVLRGQMGEDIFLSPSGKSYGIEFFSIINEYLYFKLDSPSGERFIYTLEEGFAEINDYTDLLRYDEYYGFPMFIGLQMDLR